MGLPLRQCCGVPAAVRASSCLVGAAALLIIKLGRQWLAFIRLRYVLRLILCQPPAKSCSFLALRLHHFLHLHELLAVVDLADESVFRFPCLQQRDVCR
jgi:hypothetical protein